MVFVADLMTQPYSPEWWRDRLLGELVVRNREVSKMEAYYEGDHPLPTPPQHLPPAAYREAVKAWRSMTAMSITNWVKLVADAPAERLAVTGFRSASSGPAGDEEAWRIWQRNHLDADQALVYDNALQTGSSAAIVWADADGQPVITVEHSSQVIVAYEAGSRRRRAAALKSWLDDSGREMATLYLPDGLYKWETTSTRPGFGRATSGTVTWRERMVNGEAWPLPNPTGEVTVVEFRANSGLKPAPFGGGRSEFATVLPIQDRINKTVFDQLATGESQAFRQRFVIGWDPPRDAVTGMPDPAMMLKASQSVFMTFDGSPTDVKVGEFGQADFTGFLKAVEADVRSMAAISQTPPYYLLGAMENISADGIIATEAGLVAKTRKHRDQFGESWEEVMRLALMIAALTAPDESSMVLWRDVEQRTWGQTVDALVKMQTLEVPREELWSRLPNTAPQDVARWRAMRVTDDLLAPVVPAPSNAG